MALDLPPVLRQTVKTQNPKLRLQRYASRILYSFKGSGKLQGRISRGRALLRKRNARELGRFTNSDTVCN